MGDGAGLGAQLRSTGEQVVERALDLLPGVLGAIALVLVGWLAARILRALSHRLLAALDRLLERLLGEGRAARLGIGRAAVPFGTVVFWSVMLFFVTAATQLMGLSTVTDWLGSLLGQLPAIVAGLVIIIAGWVLAQFAADLVLGAQQVPAAQRTALARAAQITIVVGAMLVGADQMGVKVTFLAIFVGAVAAAVAGGAVVAVSTGARQHVANLIGAQHARRQLGVGQRVRIAGCEGRVLELQDGGVLIETAQGRALVPGHLFTSEVVVQLMPVDGGSGDA